VTRIARRAVAAARALSEPSLELEALLASGDIELALGHIEPALERFLEARTLAKKRRDRAGLARASLGAALAAIHLGQLPVAEGHALEAARHAEKRADPEMLSDALRHLGNVARERGDLSRAAVSYRRAVKAAREHGSVDREAKALNNLGTVVQWAGRIDEALLAFERAIALKERSGAESSALLTHNNLGALFLAIGRFSEAERELGRCLAAGASPMLIEVARSNLGDLRALRGDLDGAIEAYRASLVFCRKEGVPTQESHVLVGLVRTLIMRRDDPLGEMAALLGELAALLPVGVAQLPRRYHTTRAMWLDVSGDTAGALLEAERAIRATDRKVLFSDVFGTYLEARWIRALLLARLGRRRAAARALEECRSLLGRLAMKLGSPAAARRFVEDHPLHRAIHRGDLSLPPGLTFRVDDAPSD
jgi:tetratricopeptide (TPR) repeat protein